MRTTVLFIAVLAAFVWAQDSTKNSIDLSKMKTYYMVFLYRGDQWTPEQNATTKAIQEGHLKNISRLAETGKLILAGPFLDDTNLRGIFLFDAKDEAEVKSLIATDPAIIAGRLRAEIKPWFSRRGITIVDK